MKRDVWYEFKGFDTSELHGDGNGLPGVVLGIEVAASLRAGFGDVITLVVPLEIGGSLEEIRSTSADFAVVGTVDLFNALRHLSVAPEFRATWFIPTMLVPLLLVTHGMMFKRLLRPATVLVPAR